MKEGKEVEWNNNLQISNKLLHLYHNARAMLKCPICNRVLQEGKPPKGRRVMLCENEFYSHIIIGGKHYLDRFVLNDEVRVPAAFEFEGELFFQVSYN